MKTWQYICWGLYIYVIEISFVDGRISLKLEFELENGLFDIFVQDLYNSHVMKTINAQY